MSERWQALADAAEREQAEPVRLGCFYELLEPVAAGKVFGPVGPWDLPKHGVARVIAFSDHHVFVESVNPFIDLFCAVPLSPDGLEMPLPSPGYLDTGAEYSAANSQTFKVARLLDTVIAQGEDLEQLRCYYSSESGKQQDPRRLIGPVAPSKLPIDANRRTGSEMIAYSSRFAYVEEEACTTIRYCAVPLHANALSSPLPAPGCESIEPTDLQWASFPEPRDPVEVLLEEFHEAADESVVAKEAFACVAELFSVPLEHLPEGCAPTLIGMCQQFRGARDSQTARVRTRALASLIRKSVDRAGEQGRQALHAAVPDYLKAELSSAQVQEHLGQLQGTVHKMTAEFQRVLLVQVYQQVVEGMWRPLVHILMRLHDIAAGKYASYEPVSQHVGLNVLLKKLQESEDCRYRFALPGIDRALRNAGAHSDIRLVGDRIQVGRGSGQRALVDDSELLILLNESTLTCRYLGTALEAAFLEYHIDVNAAIEKAPKSYVPLLRPTVDVFLRLADLRLLALRLGNRTWEIRGAPIRERYDSSPDTYLEAIAAVAGSLPPVESIRLQIEHAGTIAWAIIADASSAREYARAPSDLKQASRAAYLSKCQVVVSPGSATGRHN